MYLLKVIRVVLYNPTLLGVLGLGVPEVRKVMSLAVAAGGGPSSCLNVH